MTISDKIYVLYFNDSKFGNKSKIEEKQVFVIIFLIKNMKQGDTTAVLHRMQEIWHENNMLCLISPGFDQ